MDSTSIETQAILEIGKKLVSTALKSTPDNDYGVALVVLIGVVVLFGIDRWITNKAASKYRDLQDQKADQRYEREQKRAIADRLAASKAAIDEQVSREQARDRVIAAQKEFADDLRESFGKSLSPVIARIGDLENKFHELDKQIVLLKASKGINLRKDD